MASTAWKELEKYVALKLGGTRTNRVKRSQDPETLEWRWELFDSAPDVVSNVKGEWTCECKRHVHHAIHKLWHEARSKYAHAGREVMVATKEADNDQVLVTVRIEFLAELMKGARNP